MLQKSRLVAAPMAEDYRAAWQRSTLLPFALCLGACVTAPGNGGQVASSVTPVTFAGSSLAPGEMITVESAASSAGPFVAVPGAVAVSSSRPSQTFVLRPAKPRIVLPLYDFSVSTVVPQAHWTPVGNGACPAAETFVRVRNGLTSFLTFDTDTAGITCIQNEVTGGATVSNALLTCRSAQSPVLRLTTGPSESVHVGNVVIDDASDVAALACVTVIEGSLTITGTAPHVVSLPSLQQVTSHLNVTYTSYVSDPPPTTVPYMAVRCGVTSPVSAEVRALNAPALTAVGGDVVLHQVGSFSSSASTQPIDIGLNSLSTVGGSVSIRIGQFGGSPCGMTGLTHVPGNVTVQFDTSGEIDSSMNGLLTALMEIDGTLTVNGGHNTFANPFVALTRAGGLHIIKSPSTSGFHFTTLTEVTGTVDLEGTGVASAPTGLTTAGTLIVRDSGYATIETIGGSAVDLGNLELRNNPGLTTLTAAGMSKMTLAPSGTLTLDNNPALSASEVCAFVAIQTGKGWMGPRDLDGVACP